MKSSRRGPRGPLYAVLSSAIAVALYAAPALSRAQAAAASPAPQATPAAAATAPAGTVATPAPAPADAETAGAAAADDPKTLDTVEVTGFRASLERALDIKRSEVGVVDVIVAQDVADFPDLNLAESLQRIPGVAVDRDAGEGRTITVRGLGPQFTRVRLNGMEALATGGGTDSSGGVNRGRGFDFNTFASELFSSMTVRKTSSADIEEGSLGATVDLQTARPFDYDGFTFAAGGQLGYNSLSSDYGPRATLLASDVWGDGTFGALVSLAYTDRSLTEEGHSTVRWANGTSNGGFNAASPYTPALSANTFHPRIPRYGAMEHDQQRLGATASLQFRPSDAVELGLDVLYATFDADRTEDYIEAVSFSRSGTGKPQTIVIDGEVDEYGNLVYGLFNDVDIRSESRTDVQNTDFLQWGLRGEFEFTESFRVDALVGQSTSEYDNPVQTTIIMDKFNVDGYSWDYRGNNRLPVFDYGTVDPLDPTGWTLAEIRLRPQYVENAFDNAQLDFTWRAADTFTLRGGVNWKDYTYTSREWRRASETLVPVLSAADLATRLREAGLEDIDVANGRWVVPDVGAIDELFDIYSNTGIFTVSNSLSNVAANNRQVNEQDFGVYFQGDFSTDLGSVPVAGNMGVRYVQTDLTSDGYSFMGAVAVPTRVEHDYDDFLPSLNLAFELHPDFVLRFASAKVMARPNLGFLNPGATVTVSGGSRTVNTGNPQLEPFRATTVDMNLEWYFAEDALLGLGLFYKNIDSFIQTSRESRPYNTSGLPDALLIGTGAVPTDTFDFTQPLNTPGGELKGYEVSYQHPFRSLPGFWGNFGITANYTWVDSDIQYLAATGLPSARGPLVGLSERSYNMMLFYDDGRFSARVGATNRNEYITTIPGRDGNDVEGTEETMTIDASVAWNIDEHWQVSLEGLNLTDEWADQWVSSTGDRASVYTHTGRQYLLGVRFKF